MDKYLPEGYKHYFQAIKNHPTSQTINKMPESCGRPALAVLVAFYDDLHALQRCNAMSIGIQEVPQKLFENLGDVCVLC